MVNRCICVCLEFSGGGGGGLVYEICTHVRNYRIRSMAGSRRGGIFRYEPADLYIPIKISRLKYEYCTQDKTYGGDRDAWQRSRQHS